ncbi:MAG: histidine phosphatase family protein [Actinobacteria bacterium]|nr:MAG: histidine phosphatase family protein [Actinomycetota bacterium]
MSSPSHSAQEVVLVRHGETDWSRAGRHTGRTDVPLTEQGRRQAEAVGVALRDRAFAVVLTSPLARALESCRLAGFGDGAQPRDELMEWDYGAYEGRTTSEIREERPGWTLWRDGVPEGESIDQVGERADSVIDQIRALDGDALLFAHGHFLRVLTARWLELEPSAGRLFALDPATLSALGYERETPVIRLWNNAVTG